MTLCRFFCFVLVATSILAVVTFTSAAGVECKYDDVEIIADGQYHMARVWKLKPDAPSDPNDITLDDYEVLFMLYFDGEDCGNSAHATSDTSKPLEERCFEHRHVYYEFPIKIGEVEVNGIFETNQTGIETVNEGNVKAFWDDYFGIREVANRGNGAQLDSDSGNGVTPKYNCWGYSLGFSDIMIGNPDPIYNDNYEETSNPSEGGIIRCAGHVISITSINHCESPYLVIGTSEKWNHSGIYNFSYDYSQGLGDGFKDYLQPK